MFQNGISKLPGIIKYKIEIEKASNFTLKFRFPKDSSVLGCSNDGAGNSVLYVLGDNAGLTEEVGFRIFHTGHEVGDALVGFEYIGTCNNGTLDEIHIFKERGKG
jgi:hypothetical protein